MWKSEAYESLETMAKDMYYSEGREYSDEKLERESLVTMIDMNQCRADGQNIHVLNPHSRVYLV